MRTFDRESGIMLLAVLMVVMVLFGSGAVALSFSASQSNAVSTRVDEVAAFYLAEGAIETAKYEIGQNIDTHADGIGVATGQKTFGSFDVVNVLVQIVLSDLKLVHEHVEPDQAVVQMIAAIVRAGHDERRRAVVVGVRDEESRGTW